MSHPPGATSEPTTGASGTHVVYALMRFFWLVSRRKTVVLVFLGASSLLGVFYYATATRVYRASASLLVLQAGPDIWSPSMASEQTSQDQMATLERLLTSAVVLEGAIKYLHPHLPPEVDRRTPRTQWVEGLRRQISTRTLRRTSIVEIACRSRDADAAVDVVRAVVRSYLDFLDSNQKNVAAEIVSVLDTERVELEQRLTAKERELLEAQHRFGDIGIRQDSRVVHPVVQRAIRLNETLVEVQQRRVQLEASLAAIRKTVRNGGDLRQHLVALEPLIGKDLLINAVGLDRHDASTLAGIQRQLLEDQATLSTLQRDYGPEHPRLIQLMQKIRSAREFEASFRANLKQRLARIQGRQLEAMLLGLVEEDLAKTWEYESQLHREYGQAEAEAIALNDRRAEMTIIEHDLELLRNLHDVLLNRIANIDIDKNQADLRVSIINEPAQPTTPVSPNLPNIILLCLLGGLGGGVLAVYVLDVLDDRFRSPEEMQAELAVPVLAMVRRHTPREGFGADALQVHAAPDAVESEAFRTMRTALAFSGEDAGRLVVTSSEPGDGKTTVLANLGVAFAQAGKRTLLVDGDLRRPGLTNLFAMRGEPGLSEVLRSDEDVPTMCSERIRSTGVDRLDVLPCGPRPPDPAELLSGGRFADFLGWAETAYDQILIDSPPVLAASDAAIMGRRVDGVILVVQPSKNHRRRVLRAAEGLQALNVTVHGIVANIFGPEEDARYYGYADYGYDYGYGYGSAGNGEQDPDDGGKTAPRPVLPKRATAQAEDPPESVVLRRRAA